MRLTPHLPWVAGAVTALAVLFATAPRGPGLTPDGMSYLAAAQSFVRRGTLREPFAPWSSPDSTVPLADYPAGFSLALALPVALGLPAPQAARWVEALGAGAAIGVAVSLVGSLAGTAGALTAFLLLLLMPALTDVSLLVVSEPLFFLVLAGTISVMVRRPDWPLAAGILAALGNLIRYAGAFLVAGVVIWSGLGPGPWRRRAGRAALAAAPGLLLHLLWRVAGIDPGGGLAASAYAGVEDALREGWNTGIAWLAPGLTGGVASAFGVLLLVLLIVHLGRGYRRGDARSRNLLLVSAILAVLYVGTVGFARLYVIPDVPFDSRILSPFFFIVSVAVGAGAGAGAYGAGRWSRLVTAAAVTTWGVLAAARDVRVVESARTTGLDYERAEWQESAVADWLRGPGMSRTLYTTDPAGIWFVNGRPSRLLPDTLDPDSIALFRTRFEAEPSALVAFDAPFDVMAPADSIVAALSLTPVARFPHGVVWERPQKDTLAIRPRGPTSHPARALAKPAAQ